MEDLKRLIQKAQQGDKDAFGEIYKLYYKKIYRYCSFNVKENALAEDICQDTFVKAWKKIQSFTLDEGWSIQAFLFTIARNLIIDNSRKKKNYSIDEYENLQTNENFIEDIDRKDDIKRVKVALSKLDETERQIIILRYFEEMESKEVAEIVGISDGALRVRSHRVMQKLKEIMEGLYGKRN